MDWDHKEQDAFVSFCCFYLLINRSICTQLNRMCVAGLDLSRSVISIHSQRERARDLRNEKISSTIGRIGIS
jgi:hypothetical protein